MTPRRHRRLAAIATGLAAVPGLTCLAATPASALGITPPADPAASLPAPAAMAMACYGATADPTACQAASLAAIDAARAGEGVGPLLLPVNYAALSPVQQMLVVVDLERVDRGLAPVAGLDPTLDSMAQSGAAVGADPSGPSGYPWYSTWAGGEPSALATDYDWLYDDGPGSPNIACPGACWGHRNAILAPLADPTMGAGWAAGSWTVLVVDRWPGAPSFSWLSELPQIHPQIPSQLVSAAAPGTSSLAVLRVVASGAATTAAAALVDAPGYSLVTPSCTAAAGSSCDIVVDFSPSYAGTWPGTMTVNATGGPYQVTLDGISGHGYWQATSTGAVYSFGGAGWLGDLSGTHLAAPVVAMASTPDRGGYWLVASDGGVFAFGDAAFHGSTGGMRLNRPIVGMAPTHDGQGYWLVASDGGVFSFGDAAYHGSTGAMRLNQPVVGVAATPTGGGYWLVASDGGIFDFGDATFHGSTGAMRLNRPVVGVAATPTGGGYWLAASDGGIFDFGDANFHGSTGGMTLAAPVTGVVADPAGRGYWESAADGGVFNFGAPFLGSAAAEAPSAAVVGASAS